MEFRDFIRQVTANLPCELSFQDNEGEDEAVINMQTAGERHQVVTAQQWIYEKKRFLKFYTPVAKVGALKPAKLKQLLILNSSLVYGSFALAGDDVVLTATLDLSLPPDIAADTCINLLQKLAKTADSYEKLVFGRDRN